MDLSSKGPNGRIGPKRPTASIEAFHELLRPEWRERRPVYLTLTADLRNAVSCGQLAVGTRFPAERELASALEISRSTVVRAYGLLREEGWLVSRTGSGTYASCPRSLSPPLGMRDMLETHGATRHASTEVINLSVARPAPLDDLLAQAIAASAEQIHPLTEHVEYATQGLPELRKLIAEQFNRRGLPTSERQILVTTGAQQAINLVAQLYVNANDSVVLESPTYLGAIDAFRARQARLVTIIADETSTTIEQVSHLVGRLRPALVFTMPACHTITGVVTGADERKALAELSLNLQLPLIEDDIFAGMTFDQRPIPPVAAFAEDAPIFTIGSTSKLVWNGLGIGWLRAPEAVVTRLARLKGAIDLGTSLIAQLVAGHVLAKADEIAQLRLHEMRTSLDLAQRLLARTLPHWRWRTPQGGRSLWIELPGQQVNAGTFTQTALRHGVGIVAGPSFTSDGSHANHVRLMYVQRPEILSQGIERLGLAWADYAPTVTETG